MITARGTDLNLIPQHAGPAAHDPGRGARARPALVTVCQALKDVLVELGVER